MIRCIYSPYTDIYFHLATEEYLLKQGTEDVFMLWQSVPSVVIGKHQRLRSEVDKEWAKQHRIAIARRFSIKNASEKDIDELEEALQHLRKKYEETGRTSGEFELHRLYAAKTGSTFMTQTLEIVLNAIFDMMYGKFTDVLDATSAEAELESHGMIIQAIRERDVEKARKLMDEHLITSMNMFQ